MRKDRLRVFDDPTHLKRVLNVPSFALAAERYTIERLSNDRQGNAVDGRPLGESDAFFKGVRAAVEEIDQKRRIEDHSNCARRWRFVSTFVSQLSSRRSRMAVAVYEESIPATPSEWDPPMSRRSVSSTDMYRYLFCRTDTQLEHSF